MNKNDLPNFKGKCLSITAINNGGNFDLYDPHFEYQGGRLFIVGTVPNSATQSNWAENAQGALAWDRVNDYLVFESLKKYLKAIEKSEDYQKKKKSKK